MKPTNKISVLADGEQWSGSHEADLYLVSDKVLEDLQDGLKPYKIESDYKEGIDWIKKAPSILDAGNVCEDVVEIMLEQVAHYPSDKECAKYLAAVEARRVEIKQDVAERLGLYMQDAIEDIKNDLAASLLNKITERE